MPLDAVSGQVVAVESLYTGGNGEAAAAGDTCTIDGQPDVPRPLRVNIGDADLSITGLTLIITGIDEDDIGITETFHYIKGDDVIFMGKKYFKAVYEVEIDQIADAAAGDQLEVGIGAYTDVWVSLANKPIKWGSESSVTVNSTALKRNTDFYMDYTRGKIKAISGGSITAGGTVTISYTKSQLAVDLSSLADFIRVERVEYPIGDIPQTFLTWDIWGKVVYITGGYETQESMAEDRHIGILYAAEHISPTEYSPGSYPEFLDNTILLAAGAYALFIYSLSHEHQATLDMASARLEFTAITAVHTALTTALGNATGTHSSLATILGNATGTHSALAAALSNIAAVHTLLTTALGNATGTHSSLATALGNATGTHSALAVALGNVKKYLDNNSDADAAGILADITTEVANLRTAITDALKAANAYLDEVDTTDLVGAEGVWADYSDYVTGATAPSMKKYLEDGDAYLNTVDVGGEGTDVARAHAEYTRACVEIVRAHEQKRVDFLQEATARTNAAMGYTQEAAQRLSTVRSYIEQAMGYRDVASVFARQADVYIAQVSSYLRQAEVYEGQITAYTNQAIAYQSQISSYISEANVRLGEINSYISQADACLGQINAYINQAQAYLGEINAYLAEAGRLTEVAGAEMVLADRFRDEAIERRNEAWNIWRDRKQYIGDYVGSPVRQHPQYRD